MIRPLHQVIEGALVREGHVLLHTTDGKKGMELLAREKDRPRDH